MKSKVHTNWDEDIAQDWHFIRPPSRPSPSELNIYNQHLRELQPERSSVLVLGSTPEIRDLIWERGIGVVQIVDYNRGTYNVLTKEMKHTPDDERLVEQDWRTLEIKGSFDLIFGDLIMNVVPPEDHQELLQKVSKCLKKNGKFVHREWVQLPHSNFNKIYDLVQHFQNEWPNEDLYSALCLPLVSFCFDYQNNIVDLQNIIDVLEQSYKRGEIERNVLDTFRKPWRRYKTPNWILTKKETSNQISKIFEILQIQQGEDPFSLYCPIYVVNLT